MLGSTLLLRPALSRVQVNAPRVRSVGGGGIVVALLVFGWALGGGDAWGQGRPPEPVPALTPGSLGLVPAEVSGDGEELENSRALWVNNPPAVQLTGTRTTATVGETLTFTPQVSDADPLARYAYYLSRAGQADTLLSQGLLSGGAQPPVQQYTFSSEGTYTVTLYVQDRWGAWGDGAASVTVTAPGGGPLVADFVVEQLTAVDPDETKHWQVLDLSQPIEFGLRVRFRSTSTGPAAYVYWDFGDGVQGEGTSALHQFTAAGARVVTLAVYSADWSQWSEKRRTVIIGGGMQRMSRTPSLGIEFVPWYIDAAGDSEIWVISRLGRIGVQSLAGPTMLPPLELTNVTLGSGVARDMDVTEEAASARKLLVACGTSGVRVFRASRTDFVELPTLSPAFLGAGAAVEVRSIGSVALVLTCSPTRLLAVNLANPQCPVVMDWLDLPSNSLGLGVVNGMAVAVVTDYTRFCVVDVRNPSDLRSAGMFEVTMGAGGLGWKPQSNGPRFAFSEPGWTHFYELTAPQSWPAPLVVRYLGSYPQGSGRFAFDDRTLFVHGSQYLSKVDIADLTQPYLMEQCLPTLNDTHQTLLFHDANQAPFAVVSSGDRVFETWANP